MFTDLPIGLVNTSLSVVNSLVNSSQPSVSNLHWYHHLRWPGSKRWILGGGGGGGETHCPLVPTPLLCMHPVDILVIICASLVHRAIRVPLLNTHITSWVDVWERFSLFWSICVYGDPDIPRYNDNWQWRRMLSLISNLWDLFTPWRNCRILYFT